MKHFIFTAVLLATIISRAEEVGAWRSANQQRFSGLNADNALWYETFSGETPEFTVEFYHGAAGKVDIIPGGRNGKFAMRTIKSNDKGFMVIRFKKSFKVKKGDGIQFNAFYRGEYATPEYSKAFMRLQEHKDDFKLISFYPGIYGGERMDNILLSPEATWERKISQRKALKEDTEFHPVLVISGMPSSVVWDDFYVENFSTAMARWKNFIFRPAPRDRSSEMISDAELDKIIAAGKNHTGKVAVIDGKARLLIDGKVTLPVFNAPYLHFIAGKNYSNAKEFGAAGVNITRITLRLGEGFPAKTYPGFWKSKDELDVDNVLVAIRNTLKLNPDALILLSVALHPYAGFSRDFPEENWITAKDHPAYGNGIHLSETQNGKRPNANNYIWPSYHSEKLQQLYKKQISTIVAELKRTGLDKFVVGIHIAGGHDNQMSVVHLDYSIHARKAFIKYLKEKYGSVASLQAAWQDKNVTFDNIVLPKIKTTADFFDPEKDRALIDFYHFSKISPWRIAGEIGEFTKKEFGKDLFLSRFCMAPYAGHLGGSLDIDDFMRHQKFDIIIPQSPYGSRPPASGNAIVLPLASFHRHKKIMVSEFDLRSWNAAPGWEREMMSFTWGLLVDLPSWKAAVRKLAGIAFANDMGFWYADGAPGWYDNQGIMEDIASSTASGKKLLTEKNSAWQPDTAFVIDHDGFFLRNPSAEWMLDITSHYNEQRTLLTAASVPIATLSLQDLLEKPELAKNFKVIVFAGMFNIDDQRLKLLEFLQNSNRTLIFLSGTGRLGGAKKGTGFAVNATPRYNDHTLIPTDPGNPFNLRSYWKLLMDCKRYKVPAWYDSQSIIYPDTAPEDKILARYAYNGQAAVVERQNTGWKAVYIAENSALSPEYFNFLVKEAGGYVLTAPGFQCETNGKFMMIHPLINCRTTFYLPFKADVVNLFDGKVYRNTDKITVNAEAGSTYWFNLQKSTK